jgi:hypothetical protein
MLAKIDTTQAFEINTSLLLDLEENFAVDESRKFYNGSFAGSNDFNYPAILSWLASNKSMASDKKTKIAFLVGPSNLLSMLPELIQYGVNFILSVDIDFGVHEHTLHMLNCLEKSDTPEEFIANYFINNPIVGKELPGFNPHNNRESRLFKPRGYCKENFLTMLKESRYVEELGKDYFLFNLDRYLLCKEAAQKVTIKRITLDLTNEDECSKLARVFQKNNAELIFCNFTNMHEYDHQKTLSSSLLALTHNSQEFYVMFSQREYCYSDCLAKLEPGLKEYYRTCFDLEYAIYKKIFLENKTESIKIFIDKYRLFKSEARVTEKEKNSVLDYNLHSS